MYYTISHLRVLPPYSLARWCTLPRYHRSPLWNNLILRGLTKSSLYGSDPSGRFLLLAEGRNIEGYSGALWKTSVNRTVLPIQYGIVRSYAGNGKDKAGDGISDEAQGEVKKLTLLQKFKQMYRDYWYVLVPVHIVTSVGWLGGFYYLAKSGVDVVALLESLGVSQKIIEPLRDSSAGYIAIAYAMYKIATPLRYTVTLGGTTLSIKYLKEYGYIKPIPPKERLKEMYQERKDNLMERRDNLAGDLRHTKERLKERRETFMEEYRKRTKK